MVVCSNEDGDFTDCDLPVKLFANKIRFRDLSKEPLPEPRQVFVPIEGELTEENINRARLIAAYLMQDFYLTARGSGYPPFFTNR